MVRATAEVTLSRDHRDESEYREALTIVGGQAKRPRPPRRRACWSSPAQTPAVIRSGRSICISTKSSPSAGARSTCWRRSAASRFERPIRRRFRFTATKICCRQLVLNVLQNAVQHIARRRIGRHRCRGATRAPSQSASATPARDSRGRSPADLRSLRPARSVAPRSGHRSRPANRALDRRGAPRHAGARAQRPGRHDILRVAAYLAV